jgi:Protein of unknown function (DUF2567)
MTTAPTPRTSRTRAALLVATGLALTGAAVGALWAVLAPPVHGVIALTKSGDRVHAYLGAEADHFFVAAFLMIGMLSVVALIAAVLAWQWRAHRGPVMVVALALGAVAAAAAAAAVGAVLVGSHYQAVAIDAAPVTPEHRVFYLTEAPSVFFGHSPMQIAMTLLLPAATAALVYALMAVSTARDDLGGYPPVDYATVRAPDGYPTVTMGGVPPSGR